MSLEIKICTFNCHSFNGNIDVIRDILKGCDIMLLQETFLTNDVNISSYLGSEFSFFSTPAESTHFSGRPKGGLLIIWRKYLDKSINRINTNCNRINGVRLLSNSDEFLLLNIYAPYEDRSIECLNEYIEFLSCVADVIDYNYTPNVIISGDFNAEPSRGRFWDELEDFTNEFIFNIADLSLGHDTKTFLSPVHNTESWLDHILESSSGLTYNLSVLYDNVIYDHFPVKYSISFTPDTTQGPQCNSRSTTQGPINYVPWYKMTDDDKKFYQMNTRNAFREGSWGHFFECNELGCNNDSCKNKIVSAYEFATSNLLKSSNEFSRKVAQRKAKIVPGWNDNCKSLHSLAREAYLEWRNAGKPTYGILIEKMKSTRSNFKSALENCKVNELAHRNQCMKQSFLQKDRAKFWRELKPKNHERKFSVIDHVSGEDNISEVFKSKYKIVYNDNNSNSLPADYESKMNQYYNQNNRFYEPLREHDIINAIHRLNPGISFDRIHSSHLKFCDERVLQFLTCFFNAMVTHSYIPSLLLRGQIKPIIKNKFGSLVNSDNYRPIMTSSVILKCFELCMEPRFLSHIRLDLSQFGFRRNTSTSMAV